MKDEKVTMELTKGEAVGVLMERIEDSWWHDLMPMVIIAPGIVITYFIYEILTRSFSQWVSLVIASPVMIGAFFLLFKWFKNEKKKASKQYDEMKVNRQIKLVEVE